MARINFFDQMREFFTIVFDGKFDYKPQHIALYCFLLQQNNRNGWAEWFKCPFDIGMGGSGIGNKKTYYKALDDLRDNKLIEYVPGANMWKAPRVKILPLKVEVQNCTAIVPQAEPLPLQLPTTLTLSQLSSLLSSLVSSLPTSQVGRDKDYKTIDNILIDLRQIMGVFESFQTDDQNNEKSDLSIDEKRAAVDKLMAYFNFTEIADPQKMLEAGRFINLLNSQGLFHKFTQQFEAYKQFKDQSKQMPHGWRGFLGTIENQYTDGGWDAENWAEKCGTLSPDAVTTAESKAKSLVSHLD